MGAKKNFVLDTNVILHDYKCIENFQENDIYYTENQLFMFMIFPHIDLVFV